jgi:hypothetical protein
MVDTSETWLPVVGYEGYYEVSSHGRVRSVDRVIVRSDGQTRHFRGQMMALSPDSQGNYLLVRLKRDGGGRTFLVHRLMLEAFRGPCPDGMESCHGNDIKDDNRLENLRWDTPTENNLDIVANGNHHNANKTHCPSGHEYTPENTYVMKKRNGMTYRVCRICDNARNRAKYQRKQHI